MYYKTQDAWRAVLRGPCASVGGLRVGPERRGRGFNHASDEATNGDWCGRASEVQLASLARQWREKGKELFAGAVMAVLQVADFPWRQKMWSVCQKKRYKYRALESLFKKCWWIHLLIKVIHEEIRWLNRHFECWSWDDDDSHGNGNNNKYHLLNVYHSVTILPTVMRTLLSTFGELFNSVSLWSVCNYLSLILKKRTGSEKLSLAENAPFAAVPSPLSSLLPKGRLTPREKSALVCTPSPVPSRFWVLWNGKGQLAGEGLLLASPSPVSWSGI